jgi:hypothetical protein
MVTESQIYVLKSYSLSKVANTKKELKNIMSINVVDEYRDKTSLFANVKCGEIFEITKEEFLLESIDAI